MEATHRFTLRVTWQGTSQGERLVTLSLDCRTGLIEQWVEAR
jgi:hypothetical protein